MKSPFKRSEAVAEIYGHLKEKGLDALTIAKVLEALRQNGITDLEQLVKAQMEEARATLGVPRPLNLFADRESEPARPGRNSIVHQPPQMPVLIDGVLYDPEDISRFDGQALHFVAPAPGSDIRLQAFTGNQWQRALHTYFETRFLLSILDVSPRDFGPFDPQPPSLPPQGPAYPPFGPIPTSPFGPTTPAPAPPPPNQAQFFSDSNFQGDWLWLAPGFEWQDLTQVSRATVLFFSSDWNDVISSVIAWAGTVILFQDINFGGSTFTVAPGVRIPDLTPFGWNDQTSSIKNFG